MVGDLQVRVPVTFLLDSEELGLGLQPNLHVAIQRTPLGRPDLSRPFGDGFMGNSNRRSGGVRGSRRIMMERAVHIKSACGFMKLMSKTNASTERAADAGFFIR